MLTFDVHPRSLYEIECWRGGVLVWKDSFYNLVTTAGRNKLLDATFKTGEAANQWFVGLVSATSWTGYVAADTMASHGGWLESVIYANATRPAYVGAAPISGSMDNSASKAVFTINANGNVRGAFMADNSVIGGTLGTLYGVGDLPAVRAVTSGDTLNITITLTD
jgi:hypothetical protein